MEQQVLHITVHLHVANWRNALEAKLSDLLSSHALQEPPSDEVIAVVEAVPFCERHSTVYTRYEKNGRVAYLHDQANGWCRYSGDV